ncbi:hypothetical protein F4677DRAFT_427272 [Hypoxylon crocopeplum]|nr:hypothetical protein F4677DRAFT_427272 [Hypoxylon crocopeplum]
MSPTGLGPLVRLWGLRTAQLPAPNASTDDLKALLVPILEEAVPFIDSAAPKSSPSAVDRSLWKLKGSHAHADSAAKVEVSERVVSAPDLEKLAATSRENLKGRVRAEAWCCRRSVHEDKAEKGSASWDEFERCFRDAHAETEKKFTPACLAARRALQWDCTGIEASAGGLTWGDFSLVVEEMRHRIGRPVLKDRTFPVLQMTCKATTGREFLVVSIPVPDFGRASDKSTLASEKGAQVAFYVSVERIRRLDDGDGKGSVEWLMATASDAAGALPAWVQNMAAPGVIWKDVPLFLGWIAKERGVVSNGGKKEVDRGESGEVVPQTSTGVEVGNVPTVSEGTSDAAPGGPQVSTGVEISETAKVSGSG